MLASGLVLLDMGVWEGASGEMGPTLRCAFAVRLR